MLTSQYSNKFEQPLESQELFRPARLQFSPLALLYIKIEEIVFQTKFHCRERAGRFPEWDQAPMELPRIETGAPAHREY